MAKRRLLGPTMISLSLCALVADYLYLSHSPFSVSRFLAKTLAVVGLMLAPAVDLSFYGWFNGIFLPLSVAAAVLALVWLSIGLAKSAMRQATPNVEAGEAAPVLASPPATRAAGASLPARRFSLLGKLTTSFAAVGVLFGIAACAIVYEYLGRAIDREARSRVETMASGLREMAAPGMAAGRFDEVTAVLERYAARNTVAYVYIEDHEGRMVAHWPRDLPLYLQRDFPVSTERALRGVDDEYRGSNIYEIAKRLGDGPSGFVHLAVWRQPIQAEARRTVTLIAAAIGLLLLCLLGAFLLIVRPLNRPFVELVIHAERISKGDFDVPLAVQHEDELGDIARSLERMRSSLHAVTARLEEEQLARRSNE